MSFVRCTWGTRPEPGPQEGQEDWPSALKAEETIRQTKEEKAAIVVRKICPRGMPRQEITAYDLLTFYDILKSIRRHLCPRNQWEAHSKEVQRRGRREVLSRGGAGETATPRTRLSL